MSSLFNGVWKIDLEDSVVWDDKTESYAKDDVGEEIIVIRHDARTQDYEVRYGNDPEIRMGYQAEFDSPDWTPYVVRDIASDANDVGRQIDSFKDRIKANDGDRERHFVIGQPYGLIRLIYVDELTHYRVSKSHADGRAQVMMLRRMAENGRSYLATVLDTTGIIYRKRRFVRTGS